MANLLTHEEYQALAKSLEFPTNAFIDGSYRPAISGDTFTTVNPVNGDPIAEVAACDQQDIDFAVTKARDAFEDGRWSKMHPSERKEILIKFSKLIKRNRRELAVLESLDSGKTIYDCEEIDIPETINCIKWHAETIDKIYDQVSPASDSHFSFIIREPIGVVGLVIPWNFPLLMLAWKIGPALAAGCSVIVKPAEETPLTALRIAEFANEAGIPKGVLNVVPGTGEGAGEPLGRHMDVDMISFTGSTETGRRFLQYSSESNIKEVVLEMGGKNPCIVLKDAENLDRVAAHIVQGAYWNMGENCSAISRLIVEKEIKSELIEKITAHIREWPVGDPLNPNTRIGALVSKTHFDKVCSYLAEDSKILHGGQSQNGVFVEPTIVEIKHDSRMATEEIFGPILGIMTVQGFDQAISIANSTNFGLTASIFTSNSKYALNGAKNLRAGTVSVNCYGEGDITTPFGGFKQSGFGGRDNGISAHDQYTQQKTIWIDLADDGVEAVK